MRDKQFYPFCQFTSLDDLSLRTATSPATDGTRTKIKTLSCALLAGLIALALLFANVPAASAQSTAFTYQGQLGDHGTPANGTYDFQFSLYDALTNGNQIGSPLTGTGISVTNGLFTEILDFGSSIFTGADRWLQIGVQTNGGTNFAQLSPRQALTPAPYAIYAATAGNVTAGAISSAQLAVNAVGPANLQSNAVTGSKIAAGQVVRSLNGLRDDVILVPGSGLSLNTAGNVLQLSASVGDYWNVHGNSGTSGGNFLGTVDNQPLELWVNGTRALRLEPNTNSPNLISGSVGNVVATGISAATISGGGTMSKPNIIEAHYGSIGGGLGNMIHWGALDGAIGGGCFNLIQTNTIDCTIAGGWDNSIGSNSFGGVIGGGSFNAIQADAAVGTIAGGRNNMISATAIRATIGGGWLNTNSAPQGTISGGANNLIGTNSNQATIGGGMANVIGAHSGSSTIGGGYGVVIGSGSVGATVAGGWMNSIAASAQSATISGGIWNTNSSLQGTIGGGANNLTGTNALGATIAGGRYNTASGDTSTVGGGYLNIASGPGAFIGGGNENQATNFDDAVSGGFQNTASGGTAFVGGGYLNTASGSRAAIAGGMGNNANGETSFIGAGNSNTAYTNSFIGAGYLNVADLNSVIGGGNENVATNTWCVVGGGAVNKAIGYTSVVGGGIYNSATAQNAVVAGGENNTASGRNATISGGEGNSATGQWASVAGGYNNAATNDFSFAAGRRAKANHPGTFVWADSTDADVASTTNNQFSVRARGGVVFYSDPTAAFGAFLPPGGGAFSSLSDRNAKTNNTSVDGRDVLERLAAIPIATWNYRSQADSIRHIGPMAQDFARAFGVGEDDKHISTVDADGVALAAIQGLNLKLQEELKKRDAENGQLKTRLDALERMLSQITRE